MTKVTYSTPDRISPVRLMISRLEISSFQLLPPMRIRPNTYWITTTGLVRVLWMEYYELPQCLLPQRQLFVLDMAIVVRAWR